LQHGVDILIATPGRLLDLINQGFIDLSKVEIFVLDEADRMLDMGFINDVKKLITKIPTKRQTLFFSATMPTEIQHLSATILKNPQKVEVTPISSTADTIQQASFFRREERQTQFVAVFIEG
jgi:ATP-dependent RNA helicase RhlE